MVREMLFGQVYHDHHDFPFSGHDQDGSDGRFESMDRQDDCWYCLTDSESKGHCFPPPPPSHHLLT